MRIASGWVLLVVLLLAGGSPASAQEEMKPASPAESTKPDTGAPPSGPLSGPSVKPEARERTLIERDFSGKIKRLEVPPAEAAIALLDIDQATRKKAQEAINARAALLDAIVRDNLKLVVQLAGAREALGKDGQTKAEFTKLLQELSEKAQPLRDLGPLQVQLQSILPEGPKGQMLRLSQDYWVALLEEKQAEEKAAGREFRGKETKAFMRAEFLSVVGHEIKRSYDRVVGQQVKDFEALLKSLNLSEEQESTIRKVVGDSFVKTYGKASPADRARVFGTVYRTLNEDQRKVLAERLRESGGGAPAK